MGQHELRADLPSRHSWHDDGTHLFPDLYIYIVFYVCFFVSLFYNTLFLHFSYMYLIIIFSCYFVVQATQGILSMEARVFRMTEELQKKDVER